MFRNFKILFAVFTVFAIAVAMYAFAAANTVPDTKAGDGQGTVTGYVVSNIVYNLDTDPSNLASVEFDLDDAAAQVEVQLVSSGSWYSCTSGDNISWTCNTPGLTVASINQLRVVAASN